MCTAWVVKGGEGHQGAVALPEGWGWWLVAHHGPGPGPGHMWPFLDNGPTACVEVSPGTGGAGAHPLGTMCLGFESPAGVLSARLAGQGQVQSPTQPCSSVCLSDQGPVSSLSKHPFGASLGSALYSSCFFQSLGQPDAPFPQRRKLTFRGAKPPPQPHHEFRSGTPALQAPSLHRSFVLGAPPPPPPGLGWN